MNFGNKKSSTPTAQSTLAPTPQPLGVAGKPGGGYEPDNAKRMPVANSPSAIHSARRKRREIVSRGGRESTRLASSPGTTSFINSFLGGTN